MFLIDFYYIVIPFYILGRNDVTPPAPPFNPPKLWPNFPNSPLGELF
jgi:hypothetical protein